MRTLAGSEICITGMIVNKGLCPSVSGIGQTEETENQNLIGILDY